MGGARQPAARALCGAARRKGSTAASIAIEAAWTGLGKP